jgi:hypothetical protein
MAPPAPPPAAAASGASSGGWPAPAEAAARATAGRGWGPSDACAVPAQAQLVALEALAARLGDAHAAAAQPLQQQSNWLGGAAAVALHRLAELARVAGVPVDGERPGASSGAAPLAAALRETQLGASGSGGGGASAASAAVGGGSPAVQALLRALANRASVALKGAMSSAAGSSGSAVPPKGPSARDRAAAVVAELAALMAAGPLPLDASPEGATCTWSVRLASRSGTDASGGGGSSCVGLGAELEGPAPAALLKLLPTELEPEAVAARGEVLHTEARLQVWGDLWGKPPRALSAGGATRPGSLGGPPPVRPRSGHTWHGIMTYQASQRV